MHATATRTTWIAIIAVILTALACEQATGFGTVRGFRGQNAEHEHITRLALRCPDGAPGCFKSRTLDDLAGTTGEKGVSGSFGAVGFPDNPLNGLLNSDQAHCDNGDHLHLRGSAVYFQDAQKAQANLERCRTWMIHHLRQALEAAAGLIDQQGHLRADQTNLGCVLLGVWSNRAKCQVLENFGIMLHASQDFYSHTNWVDLPDPRSPVGPTNPPGLGNPGPAPWISLRGGGPFPPGLISGCFEKAIESQGCNEDPGGRVKHASLNKDEGPIDPVIGLGTTPRGAVRDNFRRAVLAAISDTREKWDLLQILLSRTYGSAKGGLMACAISQDDPAKSCPDRVPVGQSERPALRAIGVADVKREIGSGADTRAMLWAIGSVEAHAQATETATAGRSVPAKNDIGQVQAAFASKFERETNLEQVKAIVDSRALAESLIDQAGIAPIPEAATGLIPQAMAVAQSANHLSHALTFRLAGKECGMIADCALAKRLATQEGAGGAGWDTPFAMPAPEAPPGKISPGSDFFGVRARPHEPGGIKFSGARADAISLALDVTSIGFDPVHGRLTLAGRNLMGKDSKESFDLDVFADVLRLAVERYEPFFSLEPRSIGDWDERSARMARALNARFGSAQAVAQRIRAVSPPPLERADGAKYYYATVSQLDPEVAADRGHDDWEKLIFSPDWLRYSKLGWILYRADIAIKGVAAGFQDRAGVIVPSPSWGFDDFAPIWTHNDTGSGRANFELASSDITATATRVDLGGVKPDLKITQRTAGTFDDTEPSGNDRAMMAHFARHWDEYVVKEPELGQLEIVYRAYVAARYLVRKHPALAARILSMPHQQDTGMAPMVVLHDPVLRAAFRGGRLVYLDAERSIYYDIAGGYGGGTSLQAFADTDDGRGKIRVRGGDARADAAGFAWIDRVVSADGLTPQWRVNPSDPNQAAAVLDLVNPRPAPVFWLWVTAVASLLAAVVLAWSAVTRRRLPWQKLNLETACAQCMRNHNRLGQLILAGDLVAFGSLAFLGALPFLAAANEEAPNLWALALTASMCGGFAAALAILGAASRSAIDRSRGPVRWRLDWLPDILLGSRLTMLFVAAVGLWRSILPGPSLGEVIERVVAGLGSASPIQASITLGGLGALLAIGAGWFAPFAVGSMPLALMGAKPHTHIFRRAIRS